jgi:hypothetical protein
MCDFFIDFGFNYKRLLSKQSQINKLFLPTMNHFISNIILVNKSIFQGTFSLKYCTKQKKMGNRILF